MPTCNLHKADRVGVIDANSAANVPLFNPRRESWTDHFSWMGYEIVGLTANGRAAIATLHLNHPRRIKVRMAEELFALFPPI